MFYQLTQFLRSEHTQDIALYVMLTVGSLLTAILYLVSSWSSAMHGDDSMSDMLLAFLFLGIGLWCFNQLLGIVYLYRVIANLPMNFLRFLSRR